MLFGHKKTGVSPGFFVESGSVSISVAIPGKLVVWQTDPTWFGPLLMFIDDALV